MEPLPPTRWPLLPPVRTRFLPPIRILLLIFIHSVSGGSIATTPEHPVTPLPTADAESALVNGGLSSLSFKLPIFLMRPPGSNSVTTSPGDFTEDSISTAGFVRLICYDLWLWSFLLVRPGS